MPTEVKPIPEEWGEVHWKALLTFCRAHGLGGWVANRLPEDTPSVVQLELTKLRDQASEACFYSGCKGVPRGIECGWGGKGCPAERNLSAQ